MAKMSKLNVSKTLIKTLGEYSWCKRIYATPPESEPQPEIFDGFLAGETEDGKEACNLTFDFETKAVRMKRLGLPVETAPALAEANEQASPDIIGVLEELVMRHFGMTAATHRVHVASTHPHELPFSCKVRWSGKPLVPLRFVFAMQSRPAEPKPEPVITEPVIPVGPVINE